MVRAKFYVQDIQKRTDGFEIRLSPVVNGSPENESFYSYTPWGQIILGTINGQAAKEFEIGREYYVDFSRAE